VFHQLPVLKTSTCSSGRLVPWAKVSSPAPPVGIASPFIKYYRAARPAASASGSGPTGAPSRGLRRPENPQDRRPRHPAPLIRRFRRWVRTRCTSAAKSAETAIPKKGYDATCTAVLASAARSRPLCSRRTAKGGRRCNRRGRSGLAAALRRRSSSRPRRRDPSPRFVRSDRAAAVPDLLLEPGWNVPHGQPLQRRARTERNCQTTGPIQPLP